MAIQKMKKNGIIVFLLVTEQNGLMMWWSTYSEKPITRFLGAYCLKFHFSTIYVHQLGYIINMPETYKHYILVCVGYTCNLRM